VLGLARTGLNCLTVGPVDTPEYKRHVDFLKEALRRKDGVTARERMYIETRDAAYTCDPKDRDPDAGIRRMIRR
jgi:hypothetical protein